MFNDIVYRKFCFFFIIQPHSFNTTQIDRKILSVLTFLMFGLLDREIDS